MTPRVWLVTGCSSGFGRELALEILARGDRVIATARNETKLGDLQKEGADAMRLDVTAPPEHLETIAAEVLASYGRLDVLVNNAGYMMQGAIEELTARDTQKQFDTNVFGLLNVTRAFLPLFRAQHQGTIVNVSSLAAWRGAPGLGIYAASKWAVSALTEALREEVAEFGIKVFSVEPGYFRSNLLKPGNTVLGEHSMREYDDTVVRRNMEKWSAIDNTQPGDVTKGARVIVDVATQTGCAAGKDLPARLLLGSDAFSVVKARCEGTLKVLKDWEYVTKSTDM